MKAYMENEAFTILACTCNDLKKILRGWGRFRRVVLSMFKSLLIKIHLCFK